MGCFNLNFTLISFHLLLFSQLFSNTLQDDACTSANCVEGKCIVSTATLLGFDCECNPGWSKLGVGFFTLPACIVPNCTLNFQCGDGSPPPPPPPLPSLNFTSPCGLVWCGDGNCVVNETKYYCQCNEGSSNLLDLPALPCFKQCYLGADCQGVGLGHQPPPPSAASRGNGGSNAVPNCSRTLHALSIIMLSIIFLTWI
ncbi:hypothetical protein F0562_024636 [Nyssa sinensis]|uniref:EGF-like domain-containing protein n=1 Tax=Nyssa sinensis TaxID=561372 RepID=A0A5J5BB86_9ASTE|nr:hypothetical protein F0562_024636 [Nyssa sinensis]